MVPADMISRTGSSGFAGMSLLFMSKYPVMNLPVSDVILAAADILSAYSIREEKRYIKSNTEHPTAIPAGKNHFGKRVSKLPSSSE